MGGPVLADGGDDRLTSRASEGRPTRARRRALQVVRDVSRGRLLDRAAERRFRDLDARARAWALEAAYGTVRLRGRLDRRLRPFLRGRDLDPVVRDVLRLGAYQLTEMGGVPDYAAVSESVELARSAGRGRAAGLVNAVLQRVASAPAGPPEYSDPLREMEEWGSHPRWLVDRWARRYGVAAAAALVAANNRRPELYIRLVGIERDAARGALAAAGIEADPVDLDPRSLRLERGADPAAALDAVPAVVQDPAASAVARYAAFPPGAVVADLCAAPGGKSFALLDLGAERVLAFDRSARRLARLLDGAARLGLRGGALAASARGALAAAVADATAPAVRPGRAVLVDAPCTGTGTLRRHPDGRWRLGPEDLASLAALQARILKAAAGAVGPGGLLVYATCSLEAEENEEQVERFLADRPDFRLEPPDDPRWTAGPRPMLAVLPHVHGVDGAFAARMRRAV